MSLLCALANKKNKKTFVKEIKCISMKANTLQKQRAKCLGLRGHANIFIFMQSTFESSVALTGTSTVIFQYLYICLCLTNCESVQLRESNLCSNQSEEERLKHIPRPPDHFLHTDLRKKKKRII